MFFFEHVSAFGVLLQVRQGSHQALPVRRFGEVPSFRSLCPVSGRIWRGDGTTLPCGHKSHNNPLHLVPRTKITSPALSVFVVPRRTPTPGSRIFPHRVGVQNWWASNNSW